MKTTRQNDMPSAECPHCGAKFRWDDYYYIAPDDEQECPHCGNTVHVIAVGYVIRADLSTEKPKE